MNITNTISNLSNQKYFEVLKYGALTGLLQSVHDNKIFDNNYDSKILQYIRHQSLSRDVYYNVYKEVNEKSFLYRTEEPWKNIIYNFLVNTLGVCIGTLGYNNTTTSILLLGAVGGAISLQVQKFLGKNTTFLDMIFGMMSTIEGINIAQNISEKYFIEVLDDHNIDENIWVD